MTNKLIKIFGLTTLSIVMLTACQKQVDCQMNGLAIDKSIVGVDRDYILSKIGQPKKSDLEIKIFDDFRFSAGKKYYAIVLKYKLQNNKYYVPSQKCIKSKVKLELSNYVIELSNYVIWH